MPKLLPFQREILLARCFPEEEEDGGGGGGREDQEAGDGASHEAGVPKPSSHAGHLVILAKGLGLGTLLAGCLRVFGAPPTAVGLPVAQSPSQPHLVLLLNTPAEELHELAASLLLGPSVPGRLGSDPDLGLRSSSSSRPHLVILTTETPVQQRAERYRAGGLVAVTSRILIVDMLNAVLPVSLVSGILVNHAHEVRAGREGGSGMEGFILKLFRRENRGGFIHAFSDDPEACNARATGGLAQLMRTLQVRLVSLWPRFHLHVQADMQAGGPVELVETRVPLTPGMRDIQAGLVECIGECIRELKRLHPGMDVLQEEEVGVEDAASIPHLHGLLRRLFGNGAVALSPRSRHLVADIKQLASLLRYLVAYDCVSFYSLLKAILAANASGNGGSGMPAIGGMGGSPWLLLDAAQVVFQRAKERVYTTAVGGRLSLVLEPQPKLQRCVDLILECRERSLTSGGTVAFTGPILVMVDGDRGVRQLKELLLQRLCTEGESSRHASGEEEKTRLPSDGKRPAAPTAPPSHLLRKLLRTYASWNDELLKLLPAAQRAGAGGVGSAGGGAAAPVTAALGAHAGKRRRVRGSALPQGPGALSSVTATPIVLQEEGEGQLEALLTQMEREEDLAEAERGEEGRLGDVDRAFAPPPEPASQGTPLPDAETAPAAGPAGADIIIMPYATTSTLGGGAMGRGEQDAVLLERVSPSCVILLDSDLAFVRRLELYKAAKGPAYQLTVHFLVYHNSTEEQRYLSAVRRERRAFERMIDLKQGLVIPLDVALGPRDAASFGQLRTFPDLGGALQQQGPVLDSAGHPTVVVDVREFRSPLPGVLDDQGFLLKPCTLEVGDFVLAPTVVVERKSLADLIGSLRSGRLYAQCTAMLQYYRTAMLLIEWEVPAFSRAGRISAHGVWRAGTSPIAPGLGEGAHRTPSGGGGSGGAGGNEDVLGKLLLLLLHFPRLRLLWTSDPVQTGLMFADLKATQPQPRVEEAMARGSGTSDAALDRRYNLTPMDMLRRIPGITDANLARVVGHVRNLRALCALSREECITVLGSAEAGARAHAFLHRDLRAAG